MYTVTGADDVFAIDATDGTILWQYDAQLPQAINTVCCGWANRGLALGDGTVYVARLDATLVALSQQDRPRSSGARRTAIRRTATR